ELHAEEDSRKRDEIDTKNHADNLAYQTEKTLNEMGDRAPAELKAEAEGKVSAVRSAIQSSDTDQIKRAVEELEATMQRIGQEVYAGAGVGASGCGEGCGDDCGDGCSDGTVEGEFREV
ncbi:MAG: Hsp70 family protein, partial [Chloroflexi bacterium]|nr:Hsp70 family protein [Chloroflexota bacterium]